MIRGLFGSKAQIEIVTDQPRYVAGESVQATVRVLADKDLTISGGRVELLYANRYTYRERRSQVRDDNEINSYRTTDDQIIASQPVLEAGTVAAGRASEFRLAFTIPTDAPGSGEGKITQVEWKLRAILDVPRARDVHGERVITVLAPLSEPPAVAPPALTDECELRLELPKRGYLAGETVSGSLDVRAIKDLNASEIRVELIRWENVPRGEGNLEVTTEAKLTVDPQPRLAAGQTRAYSFELTIPLSAPPSFRTPASSLEWRVQSIVNRRLRSDYQALQPIQVATAPPSDPAAG